MSEDPAHVGWPQTRAALGRKQETPATPEDARKDVDRIDLAASGMLSEARRR